ncbi:MAG: urate hydroxylase PuuD, partial [Cucumibacter sp.]
GFYRMQKYMIAPPELPEHLVWFKWESYATWLTGVAMLAVVYYLGADLYLIDRAVLDIDAPAAILISLASIGAGWLIYDLLCKSPLGRSDTGLMAVLFGVLVFMAWGYTNLFTGRAAFLHLGAFTATIMSANVFFIIIPNQKIVVADMKAGRTPAAHLGKAAKQRSLHNNYLTLPVIFFMLSNHYPLAFATQWNWLIAALIFLIGVVIRHFFNTKHRGGGLLYWPWLAAIVLFILIMWLSTGPKLFPSAGDEATASRAASTFMQVESFAAARDVVQSRCSMCHAQAPVWEGIRQAPNQVHLDTDPAIAARAREIYVQAGVSRAMPPGNVTEITDEERSALIAWYRDGSSAGAWL